MLHSSILALQIHFNSRTSLLITSDNLQHHRSTTRHSDNPSLSVRPPDPFDITSDWEGPGFITLTFSNYGGDIPRQLARYCTSLAIDDADSHASLTVWNQPIGKSELLYANTQTPTAVILGVLPRPLMTWNMFHYAMLSVHQFTTNFESMAFEFEVEMTGLQGLAASGNLSILPELGSSF